MSFSHSFIFSENVYEKKLDALKLENLRLKLEQGKFRSLLRENKKLKRVLKFKKENKIDLIPLNVMSIEPSQFRRAILVSGGRNDNIKVNMYVLDEDSFLIGKISKVHKDFSEVVSIDDPSFSVPVKIDNSLGLLKGTLGGELKIFYIENKALINKGDMVWTVSYYSHSNFLVGKVQYINKAPNSFFMNITIKPFSKLYPSKTVFAVR